MGMRSAGPVQRKAGLGRAPAPASIAAAPAASSAALTSSVWMDAAHRGAVAFSERGLDPVQARGALAAEDPTEVHAVANTGVQGSGGALPYLDRIQTAFGAAHDLGGVQAHVGGAAAGASERIGAEAYATGEHVAFHSAPDLHTAAHEAAHVVQQRAGVALTGGLGQAGDAYERHADAVADRVVHGESAADLLDQAAPSGTRSAAPGVQRRSPPGAQAASNADDRAEEHADAHAADEIESTLDQPSPIAGVGDPTQSLRSLEALPLGTLLATLDELEARGRLSEIRQAMEHAPVRTERIRTALLVRDMARLPSVNAGAAPLAELAMALEALPHDEMHAAFRYMGQRRGLSRSVRMMIEGFLAMESADIAALSQQMGHGDDAAGGRPGTVPGATGIAAAGPGAPVPMKPGPWAPPGNQRPAVYVGNEAHKAIGRYYRAAHPGQTLYLNYFSVGRILGDLAANGHNVNPGALTKEELDREPDIANTSITDLFEIRPENQLTEAAERAAMFVALFRKANAAMMLGPMADPGVTGQVPAPDGIFQFWSPRPGAIVYRYRKMHPVPVPAPVPGRQGQEKPSGVRFQLEPLPEAPPEALLPATAGALMLILMMLLLAPVGI